MLNNNFNPKVIFITGASSGIGEALAYHYAHGEDGKTRVLILTGRDAERLENVAAVCRQSGAHVEVRVLDVSDRQGMFDYIAQMDDAYSIDLVIANAGISAGTSGMGESYGQVRDIFEVNLHGVLNTLEPIQSLMMERGVGQIAIVSSLAGYRGWPGAPAYCASKAAVKVYGEALRGVLKPHGIHVSVVCPGFVRSRMTQSNNFAMPFIVDADAAAVVIARGLRRNKGLIAFPLIHRFAAWFVMALPNAVVGWLLLRSPKK